MTVGIDSMFQSLCRDEDCSDAIPLHAALYISCSNPSAGMLTVPTEEFVIADSYSAVFQSLSRDEDCSDGAAPG